MRMGSLVLPPPLQAPFALFFLFPFLAELVIVILILHPLQPKPGKILKHDVIIRGIAWWWKGDEVRASAPPDLPLPSQTDLLEQ